MSGTGNNSKEKWTFGLRLLSNQVARASVRTTLTYRFHPRLTAGFEYNPRVGEFAPIANFLVLTETARRPAVMIGTSTDRIGTPEGQSFYALLSKNLRRETGLPIAPYIGAAYGTYEHRWLPVGGLNVFFTRNFSVLATYNGVNSHGLLNYTFNRHAFSLVMVRWHQPGMSYSISF